jgi:hypothetical protein
MRRRLSISIFAMLAAARLPIDDDRRFGTVSACRPLEDPST